MSITFSAWSSVLIACASLGSCLRAATEVEKPNIIYILADDMGRGDVSAYNPQSAWKTPNLDRLAQGGMLFTDAHSSSAVCTPSRYSILTGRYSWRSRLKSQVTYGYATPVIEAGRLTVAGLLQKSGYSTAMIGKWHLGLEWATTTPNPQAKALDTTDDEPMMQPPGATGPATPLVDFRRPFGRGPTAIGFDSFLGISASLDMPPYVWLRDNKVESPPTHRVERHAMPAMWRGGPESDGFAHVDVLPRLTQEAVAYLSHQDGKKPFFLYLALTAPHTPIIPAKGFEGQTHSTPYGDFCVQVDDTVGEVLQALEKNHLAGNTVVIFAADNGCSPSANFEELKKFHHDPQVGLRGEKADIYEGGHRIPFLVRWPGRVAAGSKSNALVCEMDLLATCADVTSTTQPKDAGEDSVSLLPVLTGTAKTGEVREALVHHSINGSFAIRQGPWKLCLCPDSGGWSDPKPGKAPAGSPPFQLFNLVDDPAEAKNLYARQPEIVQRLGTLLKRYVLEGRSTPGPKEINTGGNDWPQLSWMKEFQ